jgi:hypothetical protein
MYIATYRCWQEVTVLGHQLTHATVAALQDTPSKSYAGKTAYKLESIETIVPFFRLRKIPSLFTIAFKVTRNSLVG